MHNDWYICEITFHSYYLLPINTSSYWQGCLDAPDSPDKHIFNPKKNDRIFESVNYAVLNQNVYIMTIKMFPYPVELTILLITY